MDDKKKSLKQKLFALKGKPRYIAGGFALGSFIGMMPIPGFQILLAWPLAALFKVNKKAACMAVFNTNIFTGIFVFAFNYWLGRILTGIDPEFIFPERITLHFFSVLLKAGPDVLLCMLVGGTITGVICAFVTYYFVCYWLKRKGHKRRNVWQRLNEIAKLLL